MQTSLKQVLPHASPEILEPVAPSADHLDLHRDTAVYGTPVEQVNYLTLLRRHRFAVICIFAASITAGLLYALFAPKSYKTETVLEVTGINHEFLNKSDEDLNPTTSTPDTYVETQIGLLQSQLVNDRVVKVMAPQVPAALASENEERETLISKMLLASKVKEEGTSDLVRITLVGPDANLVANTANELTNQYIQQGEDARLAAVAEIGKFLTQQLGEAKAQLQQSENALQEYARASGALLTDDSHESIASEHLREIQQGLAQAQIDSANWRSAAEMTQHASADNLPQVVADPTIGGDTAKLTELRRQLADLSTTMTPENYRVQKVQAQVQELEAEIARQRAVIVSQLSVEDRTAARRQQLLEREYAQQSAAVIDQGSKQVRFNMLKHEVDVNRVVYQTMLEKVKEAAVMAALRAPSARVVSTAKVPEQPHSPQLSICGLLSLLIGAVLSMFYILILERRDNSVRKPGESGQLIKRPELAVIPRFNAKTAKLALPSGLDLGSAHKPPHPTLAHWAHADKALTAEAYRSAVTSILFSRKGGIAPKVLLVTSPHSQCGKTVTTANLAVSLAEVGRRVLLIDGDMRRPTLPSLFHIQNTGGLSNALDENEHADHNDLIRPTGFPGVSILPSGGMKGSITKMLHSPRLASVIATASSQFDFVLIDAPPVLGLADARLLGKFVDGVILICRAGRTNVDDLDETRKLLAEDGTYVLGTILNNYDLRREGSSYYSSYLTYLRRASA